VSRLALPLLRPGLGTAAVLLLGCHHGSARSGPEPCVRVAEPDTAAVPAASLAGEYRLELAPDSGSRAPVEGILRLQAADASLPPRTGPYGIPDTSHRYPLVGTAELDLAAVGAVAPGGTTSTDPAAPGVLVIERVGESPHGERPHAERILLRLGASANQVEPVRFDGGYTVLRVRRIDRAGFRGEWESGAPLPQAHGHFCAVRSAGF
jgi:hypothetical protein